jgi:succinate--hydroxymethylglutarate CoA-transferase
VAPLAPDGPAETSHLPPESTYFLAANRNKRSITVDFKKPEGRKILEQLVRRSDVLVENFIPGKLASLGLGWEDCQKLNDKLIYASISGKESANKFVLDLLAGFLGYGQTGPYRKAAGYDVVIEGEAGLMHMSVIIFCSALHIREV